MPYSIGSSAWPCSFMETVTVDYDDRFCKKDKMLMVLFGLQPGRLRPAGNHKGQVQILGRTSQSGGAY